MCAAAGPTLDLGAARPPEQGGLGAPSCGKDNTPTTPRDPEDEAGRGQGEALSGRVLGPLGSDEATLLGRRWLQKAIWQGPSPKARHAKDAQVDPEALGASQKAQ